MDNYTCFIVYDSFNFENEKTISIAMKNCHRIIFTCLTLFLCFTSVSGKEIKISVSNELPQMRKEMVEVTADNLPQTPFVITDNYGAELPWQRTYTGNIIFPATVGPKSTVVFTVKAGKPAKVEPITFAAFYPERIDDIAWENDYSAYRAYGPGSKNEVSGYDVFTKCTTRPVVPERYFNELVKKISYHIDHGDGMDQYDVGPTLGAGASAPVGNDGKLILPGAFSEWEILDKGPLRTTIRLTFEYEGGRDVRTITLNAGCPFNHTVSKLEGFNVDSIAAGIVIHKPATEDFVLGNGYVAYSDPTSTPNKGNGRIFVGVINPNKSASSYKPISTPWKSAVGHALSTSPYKQGNDFSYYWGSSWSKGRIPTFNQWVCEIENFKRCLDSPLKVVITK